MLLRPAVEADAGEFTVNASHNAMAVYERWGLVSAGEMVDARGLRCMPMRRVVEQSG